MCAPAPASATKKGHVIPYGTFDLTRTGEIRRYTPDSGVDVSSQELVGRRLFGDVLQNLHSWQVRLEAIVSRGTPCHTVDTTVAEGPSGVSKPVRLVVAVEPPYDGALVMIGRADS